MIKILTGPNDYAAKKYIRVLSDNYDTLNYVVLEQPTMEELIEQCSIPPLMATSRSVIVYSLKKINGKIFENFQVPNMTHLVIQVPKLPAAFSYLKERGVYRKFDLITKPSQAIKYIQDTAEALMLKMDEKAVIRFFTFVGLDEAIIDNEMEKMVTSGKKKFTEEDIYNQVEYLNKITPFQIIEALFSKDGKYTFQLVEVFLANGNQQKQRIELVSVLLWKFRRLMIYYWSSGSMKEIENKLEVTPYVGRLTRGELHKTGDPTPHFLSLIRTYEELLLNQRSRRLERFIKDFIQMA